MAHVTAGALSADVPVWLSTSRSTPPPSEQVKAVATAGGHELSRWTYGSGFGRYRSLTASCVHCGARASYGRRTVGKSTKLAAWGPALAWSCVRASGAEEVSDGQ